MDVEKFVRVVWSCVTRCRCGTTSSTLFTVHVLHEFVLTSFFFPCAELALSIPGWVLFNIGCFKGYVVWWSNLKMFYKISLKKIIILTL
jgi:hypothetical protein